MYRHRCRRGREARACCWFRAVSPAVIKGMLAGIGILIFVSQFHVMLEALEPHRSCVPLDLLMSWATQHEVTGGSLIIDGSSLHGRFSEGAEVGLERVRMAS